MTTSRAELIHERLTAALNPTHCEVIDESHKHAGHVGARDGRGHFKVRIVSDHFTGLSPLARHRLVYESLGELMKTDVHALSIEAAAATNNS